jgi:hypothetical protein
MLTVIIMSAQLSAAMPVTADVVFKNARVWTVDTANPEAESIAVWCVRILSSTDQPQQGRVAEYMSICSWARQRLDLQARCQAIEGGRPGQTRLFGGMKMAVPLRRLAQRQSHVFVSSDSVLELVLQT